MKKKGSENRTNLQVRITPEEYNRIDEATRARGYESLSDAARDALDAWLNKGERASPFSAANAEEMEILAAVLRYMKSAEARKRGNSMSFLRSLLDQYPDPHKKS